MSLKKTSVDKRLTILYRRYTDGEISRREFMRRAGGLGLSGLTVAGWMERFGETAHGAAQAKNSKAQLDIAEWSFFWVGVEREERTNGVVVNGKQMYVEYQIPARVRYPYSIVLVHGGGGQGLDWMGTPDGRRGWSSYLLEEGFKVYVVDRPGHGRSPFHPDLHGGFPQQNITLDLISQRFTSMAAKQPNANQFVKKHNQWPGTGEVGTPELAQLVASQGGSFINPVDKAHQVWRERGALLLDKVGPAIIMTHSAGGPFGWLVAEARPNLVKGIVVIEGGGTPFDAQNRWGLSTIPVTYDPPVSDSSEIKTKTVTPTEPGVQPYKLQEEPARKLKNLQGIPMVIVTAEASFASPGNPGAVAFLKQAGCKAEELRLADHNIHGNGHMMMCEKNNREVLQPILDWIKKNVSTPAARVTQSARRNGDSTAVKLADQGHFWVGTEHKKMSYGTIVAGQMFVQYKTPAQVRHPFPVVLVHGGGGQGTHYMGVGDGSAGWAHYYLQEGYKVYIVDRPGHGRSPYHPDALGPITPVLNYASVTGDFKRAANNPNRKWMGTGDVGDPVIDQFQAGQNSAPQDNVLAQRLWARDGAELLDKIGPAIIQTHSAGGPFGWLVANERPNLVKAVVCVEGGGNFATLPVTYDPPVSDPSQLALRDIPADQATNTPAYKLQSSPVRKLKNLQGIPIVYLVAESSGRNASPTLEYLKQAGCTAEALQLKDRGILGNGHFMMLETNRRQVFDVVRGWIEGKVRNS
jgi:pimeloyl-ACP methyl ester carboxylesterase